MRPSRIAVRMRVIVTIALAVIALVLLHALSIARAQTHMLGMPVYCYDGPGRQQNVRADGAGQDPVGDYGCAGVSASQRTLELASSRWPVILVAGSAIIPPNYDGASQTVGSTQVSPRASGKAAEASLSAFQASAVATKTAPGIKAGSVGGPTAGKPFSPGARQQELANNPGTCVYCRMENDTPQVDHVIPRVRGGNPTVENAQTTCPTATPRRVPGTSR